MVTIAELHLGVLAAADGPTRARRLETLTRADSLDPLPIDRSVAVAWAALRVALRDAGARMPLNDSWIAATALARNTPVVSRDGDYDWPPLNVGLVLHLHRLLMSHAQAVGGAFKHADNLVVDRLTDGSQAVRFRPVPARDTPWAMQELLDRYVSERRADQHHPLLLVGLAVLDLLVIHPFEDGNGRVARLLTNALLTDAGYGVARYVSLEQLVAESADAYYASLLASTHGWHEGLYVPWPWLTYFVRQVGLAYDLFGQRAASITGGRVGKRDRVKRYVLEQAPARFRIADVRRSLPGISDGTIRNALDDLRDEGKVNVDGPGRGATWFRP